MTTKTLHPVKWMIERAGDGFYAYGFGGGLPSAVTTNVYNTEAEALAALKAVLAKVGRCPDPEECNMHSAAGRALKAVLSN
jgi:hypothetical protein